MENIPVESALHMAQDIGKITQQLKEILHDKQNSSQRNEAVARSLSKLEDMPGKLDKLSTEVADGFKGVDTRLKRLELEQAGRESQARLWVLLLRSPAVGWAVGIVLAACAYMFGRGQ